METPIRISLILKGGYRGRGSEAPPVPRPSKIQIFVWDCSYEFSEEVPARLPSSGQNCASQNSEYDQLDRSGGKESDEMSIHEAWSVWFFICTHSLCTHAPQSKVLEGLKGPGGWLDDVSSNRLARQTSEC